jgi:predicted  nucleic acid-binding Zn-ribbon protein
MGNTFLKTVLLSATLSFCIGKLCAQSGTVKIQALQRIKIVKTPVKGEENINAALAAMDSRMQTVQAEVQKAQADLDNLKSIQNNLKGQLDAMNEMSEMTSMRLQMAMDRRSKFVEALSNIMKKIDETSESIVQNMK